VISGSLGDIVITTNWNFQVTITDIDPLNPANRMTASFDLTISTG
jgi:hypothetical protein